MEVTMVRLLAVGSAVIILGCWALLTQTSATVTPHEADVNQDGAVSIADAISVLPHIGESAPIPTPVAVSTYIAENEYTGPSGGPTLDLEAECDPGDAIAGGGVSTEVPSVPLQGLVASAPYQNGQGQSGWRTH